MKKAFLYFILITGVHFWCHAQNLVPNPGFELAKSNPLTEAETDKLLNWLNPNQSSDAIHFPAADFLHMQGDGIAKVPNAHFGNTRPFNGSGMVGLVAYNELLTDFREYITVRLQQPLDTSKEYRLVCHISTGQGNAYGNYATSVGALFSMEKPYQNQKNIQRKPQLETGKPIESAKWEKYVFPFKPDSAYEYMTIGNFRDDLNITPKKIQETGFPCAYYFIDDISLEIISPPTEAAKDTTVAQVKKSVLPSILQQVQGRRISKQQTVAVDDDFLEIKIWDDREEDDDQISLNLNGKWIVEHYTTTKKPLVLTLSLVPGEENFLILFAHSLGSKPPNTAAISLKDKEGKVRKLVLKSDLQSCGAIEIICSP